MGILQDRFNEARASYPHLIKARARPLGHGLSALVVDNGDDSVTKILYSRRTAQQQAFATRLLFNEVNSLDYLTEFPIAGLATPKVLGDPEILEGMAHAAFRMTKIGHGTHGALWKDVSAATESYVRRHFHEAGAALARFHRGVENIPSDNIFNYGVYGGRILTLPHVSDKLNEALTVADAYLAPRAKAGVMHGDCHGDNFMRGDNNTIMGMIDLEAIGRSGNIYLDFLKAPSLAIGAIMIEGYESVTAIASDPHILELTILADLTHRLSRPARASYDASDLEPIRRNLIAIADITGYAPPTL